MTRIAILCPGRGSYTERSLGSLPGDHEWVRTAEHLRRGYDLPSLLELDRAERFDAKLHLRPANVSALTWLVGMLDAAQAMHEHEAVCVAGNSMGWYTALAATGALSFEDGFRLVQEMALLQEEHQREHGGGQVMFPLVGDDWRPDPARAADVARALADSDGEALPSIHLGGYAVLAGSEDGVRQLLASLPKVELGRNLYPLRLMQHGPYHTPLVQSVAKQARERLADLVFRAPQVTLIDGRGVCSTPWSTDPDELAGYTFGEQVVAPYDVTASVRVALREYAPDQIVCPGPGNTLGGVCGQVFVREGWRGVRARDDFDRAQQGTDAPLRSMRR